MAVRFEYLDAAIIRAAAFPRWLELPPWPDLTGDDAKQHDERRAWLSQVWCIEPIAHAIEIASPALTTQVRNVLDGQVRQPQKVRRTVESVVLYLLRAITRATPFGLFAGVAPISIGPRRAGAGAEIITLRHVPTRRGSPNS